MLTTGTSKNGEKQKNSGSEEGGGNMKLSIKDRNILKVTSITIWDIRQL